MDIERKRVMGRIKPGDKVLDIGSWNDVFPRADVVIDLNPYETRKLSTKKGGKEHFTKDSWIIGDISNSEVWSNFQDNEIDYAICSHLLEDIRDPLFVCEQLNRVAKAGYIECPSRLRECSKVSKHDAFSGYDHHRWILDIIDNELVFTPKLSWAHSIDYLGESRRHYLRNYSFHFTGVFWEESFSYYERTPKGDLGGLEGANLMYLFDTYNPAAAVFVHEIKGKNPSTLERVGKCLYNDQFKLPVEELEKSRLDFYLSKYKERVRSERMVQG